MLIRKKYLKNKILLYFLYYCIFCVFIYIFSKKIQATQIIQEGKVTKILEEILVKKRNAETELNIAKKLKNKIDHSFVQNFLLDDAIQTIENENDKNTAIGQLTEAQKAFQQETNEILLDQIVILLKNSLQNYNKSITNIKKYKTLVNREIIKKEITEIKRLLDKTNDFFYNKESAINIKKEIQQEMENIETKETAANLFNKAKLILEEAENNYSTNNNINNNENINNKYDRATFYFQESFKKYQKIKINLKNFFIEIFQEDKIKEEQNSNNNKITSLLNEQNKLQKQQIIMLIMNLTIFIFIFFFIKKKYTIKNILSKKIPYKELTLKKSL
ncbi:MAG: hypothetical protein Q2306_01465 [Phytoplasma sp.]|uniref:hypothetical protein n=1 Tax=Phytoplasma sp. TaxID=2155 RepID=UPI002B405A8F|nr:hypothetical protein [Phytoplasma sp.]WRH06556.1 MAG: hypothetical protein Q2306_01465 [Phytoplasma sp.]